MAIIDAFTTFSGSISAAGAISPQSIVGSGTIVGTNSYDTTGNSPNGQNIDLGKGEDLSVVGTIGTGVAGATSVEMQFVSADDGALTTNVTVLASTGAVPVANLAAGKMLIIDVPPADPRTVRRYVGVQYVLVGTSTTGTIFTTMKPEDATDTQTSYASGYSIL